MNEEIRFPEHEKLQKIHDQSQACGMFLEWLQTNGNVICHVHEHTDACLDDDGRNMCGYRDGEWAPDHESIEKRLARYFGIDLQALETEKQQILADLRADLRVKP